MHMCVCAARLTLLALLAASSMLLAGGLLQGSALDKNSPKNQDLENGPCAQTSSVGSSTLKCLETICFLLNLMMNFCRVPLLVLSKYLELGKLRQLRAWAPERSPAGSPSLHCHPKWVVRMQPQHCLSSALCSGCGTCAS